MVSVVIITRNRPSRASHAARKAAELEDQPEVIVVDNGSRPDHFDALESRLPPHVRLIGLEQDEGSAARTRGVVAAESEIVAFADDDSWWTSGSLDAAETLFHERPRLGLLAARVLGRDGSDDPINTLLRKGPVLGHVECGVIVRKRAYLGIGGYHPRFGVGGEERLLTLDMLAAGWETSYTDSCTAIHDPDDTARNHHERERQRVRNDLWTAWLRYPISLALAETRMHLREIGALTDAAEGLSWVLGERHSVPKPVAQALRDWMQHPTQFG